MPERWQRELRKLKSVQPPGDLWDRVMLGPRLATEAKAGRRWPGRVAPLAAAAAVVAVIAGTAAVSSAIHGPRTTAGASPAHLAIAYVANSGSGTVTPIRTATGTALPSIKTGSGPDAIAITPDGKTAYVANGNSGTVTPIDDRHRHRAAGRSGSA